jgi:branched-chain amino acid transport system permease protein
MPPRATVRRSAAWLVVLLVLAGAPQLFSVFRLELFTEVLIFALAAASLDLLVGYAGLPSLGHAAFLGLGSYAAGLTAIHLTDSALVGLVVAMVAGATFGVVTGALAVRTRGIYFLMLTLAFGELLASLSVTWVGLTGGTNGLAGIPAPRLPGFADDFLRQPTNRYFYVLAVVAVGFGLLHVVATSPFGRSLVGIRENEARMRSLGYPVDRFKLAAFVFAGMIAALAGATAVQFSRFVSPEALSFKASVFLLLMPLLGGAGRLWGAAVGALLVVFLRQELSSRFDGWELGLGVLLLIVAYALPQLLARTLRRSVRRPVGAGQPPEPEVSR